MFYLWVGFGVGLALPTTLQLAVRLLARLKQPEHPADTRKRMVEWLAGMRPKGE